MVKGGENESLIARIFFYGISYAIEGLIDETFIKFPLSLLASIRTRQTRDCR
jgi:hypothetical protein